MGGELSQRLLLPFAMVQLGIVGVVGFILSLGSGLLALVVGTLISPILTLFTLLISVGNAAFSVWMREWRKSENFSDWQWSKEKRWALEYRSFRE